MRFKIGDMVKPKPGWDVPWTAAGRKRPIVHPPLPSGKVTSAEAFGVGQILIIDNRRPSYLSGCFDLDVS